METDNESQSTPKQVMDVQPPKQTTPVDGQGPMPADQVVPVSVEETVATVEEPESTPAPASTDVSNSDPTPAEPVLAATPKKEHSRHTPILAIACAVIIAGVFAAVAVMSYLGNSDQKDAANKTVQSSSSDQTGSQNKPAQATTADIDTASSELDKQLNSADDSTDYADTTVSDTTLGL